MTSVDSLLYSRDSEDTCFECNFPIIVYEPVIWCEFCSKRRHRKCTDFTLEEYCRQFECGRGFIYSCTTCKGSYKEAAEFNAELILKERQEANPDDVPDTKQLAITAGEDEEYESGSDEELDWYTDSEEEFEEILEEADMSDQSDTEDEEDLISEADMGAEDEETFFNSHSSFKNAMTQTDIRIVETTAPNWKDFADATTQTDGVTGGTARREFMGTDTPIEIGTSGFGHQLPSIMDVEANPGRCNGYYYFHTTKIVYWKSTETSQPTLLHREDTMIRNSVPDFNLRQLESTTSILQNTQNYSVLQKSAEQTESMFAETKDQITINLPETSTCNRITSGNRNSQTAAHQTEDGSTETFPSPSERKSDRKGKRARHTEIPNSTPPQEMNKRKRRRRVNKHVCPYC